MFRVRGVVVLASALAMFVPGKRGEDEKRVHAAEAYAPITGFLHKGMSWLAEAQLENGGWGAGTHARQDIRDPKAVQADPATTAISALALVRAGNGLQNGTYSSNVSRALGYLLEQVEQSPEESPTVTSLTGTQPQIKLGQNIDVSLCAQFLTRILPLAKTDKKLEKRVASALDKCLRKIERGQTSDGSFSGGTWAGVLQSAMANSALENAEAAGRRVDTAVLERSRGYQKGNLNAATGEVKTDRAAGVPLYSITSNQRATAQEARTTADLIKGAKEKGILEKDAKVNLENLIIAGVEKPEAEKLFNAYEQHEAGKRQLEDDRIMSGFGNNGGEEYLSYMMTSESMVIGGTTEWDGWSRKMGGRFEKIQNSNGSWSGYHCITSPVFCTAAVIMTMTADRDARVLVVGKKNKR